MVKCDLYHIADDKHATHGTLYRRYFSIIIFIQMIRHIVDV